MLLPALAFIVIYSFWESSFVTIVHHFTWDNYSSTLKSTVVRGALIRSILLGVGVATLCCVLAFPFAWFVANGIASCAFRTTILLATIFPFLVCGLIRAFAWLGILGRDGLVNTTLTGAGLIGQPINGLLFGWPSVIIALVYNSVQLAFFPIYLSVEALDRQYVQAGRDLGAGSLRLFARVVLPLCMTGIMVGWTLVFAQTIGALIEPAILGGAGHSQSLMSMNVYGTFLTGLDWPGGTARAVELGVSAWLVIALFLVTTGRVFRVFRR
jgi:spermidine/putrescine transport system permease protein